MGLIRRAAGILTLGGVSSHSRRDSQARAAKAQADLAEAEMKVAGEQAAAIARALHEDEAHQQADLEEVAGLPAVSGSRGRATGFRHSAAPGQDDAGHPGVCDRQVGRVGDGSEHAEVGDR